MAERDFDSETKVSPFPPSEVPSPPPSSVELFDCLAAKGWTELDINDRLLEILQEGL